MKNLPFCLALFLAFVTSSFTRLTTYDAASPENKPPAALYDYFLKLEGIDGESGDYMHEHWIELESFVLNTAAKTATITRRTTPVSSPALRKALAQGKRFDKVIIHQRASPGSEVFLTFELKDTFISGWQTSASSGSSIPTDSFSLNYEKISWR